MRLFATILIVLAFATTSVAQAEYEVIPASKLNSAYNDFGAQFHKNGLMFCSNKKNDILLSYLNEATEEPLVEIYFAERKEFGKYGSPKPIVFEEKVHTDNGPFCFGPDSTLYLSRSYRGKKGSVLGIFFSYKNGDTWTKPEAFVHNHPEYMVGHPTYDPFLQRLYFAANYDDGFGKSDLYYSDWVDGTWSEPVNLGKEVNTKESELFPELHPEGSLYFSSDRNAGFGGLDIYKYDPKSETEEKTELLSATFNSPGNDFGYTVNADKSSGYFTSDREGTDDIYEFRMVKPGFANCDTLEKNSYCYVFYDAANISLDTLPLRYEWDLGDGTKIRNLKVEHCYQEPGSYEVALNIIDTLTGDLFFSQANYALEVEEIEQVYIETPDSVALAQEVTMHGQNTYLPGFEIATYHWYFSDGSYFEGDSINHQFNTLGTHTVTLGLRSKPNAQEVVEQACIQKQIEVLDAGEHALMASVNQSIPSESNQVGNDNRPDGGLFDYLKSENDTVALDNTLPEETIYRVEIKKSKERLSTLDQFFDEVRETYDVYENFIPADSVFSYAIGQETKLCNTYPIYTYVQSMNYSGANVKAYLPEHVYDLDDMDMISEEDLNRAVFRTGAIYFETEVARLKTEANPTLNKIFNLMEEFPTLQLEVGAHTDSTGSAEYNQQLSNARAAAVIEYLAAQGIDAARLIGVGYGSEMPIGDNETEEGRKLNRRVEFKVVSQH